MYGGKMGSSQLLTESQQLALLRCRTAESGYRNVYRKGRDLFGNDLWVAKVKRGGRCRPIPGSRSTTPHDAALHVLRWYQTEFGPNWPDVLAARKVNPFEVRWSDKYGGYVATAWVLGKREEVVVLRALKRNRWATTDRLAVFYTRDEARAGIRRYLRLRYGLFARCVLFRAAPMQRSLAA